MTCQPDWQVFDNTVLGYTICYPPGWGLTTGESPGPLARIGEQEMTRQITIGGPGYFPLPANAQTIDSLPPAEQERIEEAPRVLLNYADRSVGFEGCMPNRVERFSGIDALWCDDTYSIIAHERAEYRPDGDWQSTNVLVPLRSAESPTGPEPSGSQLLLTTVSLRSKYQERQDLFWEIIRSIRVY